jgi:hypothetical protein
MKPADQYIPQGNPWAMVMAVLATDPAWLTVRQWPGLSAAAKLAWLQKWTGTPSTFQVHCGALGEYQGTSDRAGRNSAEQLRHHGLWDIRDWNRGMLLIFAEDPVTVAKGRLLRVEESQGQLFESLEPAALSPDPGVVPLPDRPGHSDPEVSAHKPPVQCNTLNTTLDTPISSPSLTLQGHCSGGLCAETSGSAETEEAKKRRDRDRQAQAEVEAQLRQRVARPKAQSDPPLIGELVDRRLDEIPWHVRLIETQHDQAQKLADRFTTEVADPSLYPEIARRVAWAIVEGKLPQKKVDAVLRRMKERPHLSPQERGKYFNGAMEKVFNEVGLIFKERPRANPNDAAKLAEGID